MSDEALRKLERLREDELRDYVRSRLLGKLSEPMVVWSKGEEPEWFLEDAYARSVDEAFRARLRRVVGDLLVGWQPALNDSIEYGGRLAYLLGRLRVEGGSDILSRLASQPDLDGLTLYGEPLKNVLLRTLLDFPGQEAKEELWEPLLEVPDAFDAAFFAFSLRSPDRALEHLRRYLDMAFRTGWPESMIEFRLAPFVQRCLSSPSRVLALRRVIFALQHGAREKLLAMLRRAVPEALERMETLVTQGAHAEPVHASVWSDQFREMARRGGVGRAIENFLTVADRDRRG